MKFDRRQRNWAVHAMMAAALTALAGGGGQAIAAEPAAAIATSNQDKPIVISGHAAREAARVKLEPEYPAAARQFRLSGDVTADVIIGLDGKVEKVTIGKGNPILNSAVAAALKKWSFAPILVDGCPTRAKSTLTFSFKL